MTASELRQEIDQIANSDIGRESDRLHEYLGI
jgi:hypothetical protein